jgi:hypothetical protein
MSIEIAQIFRPNGQYIPTKASLYLRPAGSPTTAFSLSTTNTVIDASNYRTIDQSYFKLIFSDSVANFTGNGYVALVPPTQGAISNTLYNTTVNNSLNANNAPSLHYPIQAVNDGLYYVYMRILSTAAYVHIRLYIDNHLVGEHTENAPTASWQWITASFVAYDNQLHDLKISVESIDCKIDKIVFSKSATVPTGNGPSYTTSPFVTAHARIATTINDLPSAYLVTASSLNTLEHIIKGGWYSFDLNTISTDIYGHLIQQTAYNNLALVLSVSGASSGQYVVWDISDSYSMPIATNTNFIGWSANTATSMAVRIYSDNTSVNEYNCTITTPQAVVTTLATDDFSETQINGTFNNTSLLDNDVVLDVNDKSLTFVIDQSGSMTWNDPNNDRFTYAENILDVLDAKYPGNVKVNVLEFKGEQCFPVFIPLTTQITSGLISDVISAHFANDSSNFAGFKVVRKEGSYPSTSIDGEIVSVGYALAALDLNLEPDTNYYYTVFTYDQLKRPSRGVQLNLSTHNKIVPRGLPNITATVFAGYDLISDPDMISLWNMDEATGSSSFNFTNTNLALLLSNTQWLSTVDVPVGFSGLRFNGTTSSASTIANTNFYLHGGNMTFMFWLLPMDLGTNSVILSNSISGETNYSILINNGNIKFVYGNSTIYTCSTTLSTDTWYHIAITVSGGTVRFYIDGVLANSATLSVPAIVNNPLTLNLGYDSSGTFINRFFGKLTHLSIYNITQSSAFISNAVIGRKSAGSSTVQDNGDRVVAFNYVIPPDANYTNFRIIRNLNSIPSWWDDGDVVTDQIATPGRYVLGSFYDYDINHNAYFRVFTKNAIGNWCDIGDATLLSVNIPDTVHTVAQIINPTTGAITTINQNEVNPAVPIASNIDVQPGNAKTYLTWDNPSAPASRVVVYYSADHCPYFDNATQTILGGEIVFDTTKSVTEFVHRNIPNNQVAYYAIVPTDKLNRFNSFIQCVTSYPQPTLDDSGIPLLEALNVSCHLNDFDQIKITWDSPVTISSSTNGYFDDIFYCYAAICDLYGDPIPLDYPTQFKTVTSISNVIQTKVEDVFGLNLNATTAEQLPNISFTVNPNGLVTGVIRLQQSNLFAILDSLTISATATYSLSDKYTFSFPQSQMVFQNPLSVKLLNKDALYINTNKLSPPGGCVTIADAGANGSNGITGSTEVNGAYIRRKLPFDIRALYTYRGNYITAANVVVKVFDATGGPCSFSTSLTSISKTVSLTNASLHTSINIVPILDQNGTPTTATENISYTDFGIGCPQLPQGIAVYVKVQANGYIALRKMYVIFPSILQLDITATAPASNNTDVREQFVRGYIINPDDPTNLTEITTLPDNTVAKWQLLDANGQVSHTSPFYSTDDVPLAGGIFSFFRNGAARQVFFGPAQPASAGNYTVVVSTTYNGLFAQTSAAVTIKAKTGVGVSPVIPDPTKPRILGEFPNCINYVWADGVDYQKMIITRDATPSTFAVHPERSNTKYANQFRSCASADSPIVPILPNTPIIISAPQWEIISGVVTENISSIDGRKYLDTSLSTSALDTLTINMSSNPYTYVYFRQAAQIDKPSTCRGANMNSCVCFDPPTQICKAPYDMGGESEVILSAKINYNGKPLTIYGGGGRQMDGRPPTILIPVEPTYIRFIGLFVNNVPVENFVIDGVTKNYLYFEMRYSGLPVPNNTELQVFIVADRETLNGQPVATALNLPSKVYTVNTTNLPGGVVNTNPISIIAVPVGPIPTSESIEFAVYVQSNYSAPAPIA